MTDYKNYSLYCIIIVVGLSYFWCCKVQSDISIEKFDNFEHNRIQNALTYDHDVCSDLKNVLRKKME